MKNLPRRIQFTLLLTILHVFINAQVSPFSLLLNGDFESGGTGFQTLAPYNFLASLTGNCNPGDNAITPNPQPMNTSFFISGTDHSGSSKMLVIGGSNFGGNPRFWKAPPPPLGVRYNVISPSCSNATDGFIAVYGTGGTPPYTYSYNGGPYSSSNVFSGLGSVSNAFVSVKDATTPTAAVVFSPSNITLSAPVNPLSVRPDSTICNGATLPLYASGSSTGYTWSSAPTDPSIANPNVQNTTATPTQNTVYTVTSSVTRNRNLIYNGDFEQGDMGFESQYNYYPFPPNPANPGYAQNAYSIVNNAQQFEPQFQPCVDHTSGSGKFMTIDGATTANIKLWSQKVSIAPNTNYTVGYWLQSIDGNSPAQLEMQMNGAPITGSAASSTATATTTTCSWQQITYNWNSGANTTVEIQLINRNVSANGNDFSIDDISMTHSVVCTFTKSCNITVNSSSTPVTNFSYNSPVCLSGTNPAPVLGAGFTTGGVFSSTLGISINGSTGVINLATSSPGTYTITYTVTASACQSAGSSTAQITLSNSLTPVTTFSYATPVCTSVGNLTPTTAIGFSGGGTFSSTAGLSLNTSTGAVNTSASTPGTYTITYSVSATACQPAANSNNTLTINAAPVPPTATSLINYCLKESATALTATGTSLRWYTQASGGTGSNSAPIPSTDVIGTTTYYVTQSNAGCESIRIPIEVIVTPGPSVDAGPDIAIVPGQSATLSGTTNALNPIISWTPAATLNNPSILNPTATPTTSTQYYLRVQQLNCTSIDSMRVVVISDIIVPNVFSPNGDGIHDRWIIQRIEDHPNAVVEIFNRYGQSIVRRTGYNTGNAWDGKLNEKLVPAGIYYYVIQGLVNQPIKIGSITLLR